MALALEPCDQERAHPVCRAPDEATQGGQARRRVAAWCGWQFEPKWDGFRCLIRRGWRDRNPGRRNAVVRSLATSPASRRVARAEACGRDAKCRRTADCVVGGFRYASNAREVGSLRLGLYNDEGKLDHVGFTATIRDHERQALTERLEALISPPGFSGNAPDGPSRWNTERTGEWQPSVPSWWSRFATTTSAATAFATARSSCAGTPTRRRVSAPSSRSSARRRHHG